MCMCCVKTVGKCLNQSHQAIRSHESDGMTNEYVIVFVT